MTIEPPTGEHELRDRAVRRLKDRADFRLHLLMFVVVNAFLVVIWAMSGAAFFWPVFPIAGWGIGLVAHAWDAYGRGELSEDRIRREMDRMSHK